jgi:hypothetical protein
MRSRAGSFRSFFPGAPAPTIDDELLQLSSKFSAPPPEELVPSVDLETYLVQVIAHYDRVPEQAIDDSYIRQRRERDIYPDAVYREPNGFEGSIQGGYDGTGLENRTRREHEEFGEQLDAKLSRFSAST